MADDLQAEQRRLKAELTVLENQARPVRKRLLEIAAEMAHKPKRQGGHYSWDHCVCRCICPKERIARDEGLED